MNNLENKLEETLNIINQMQKNIEERQRQQEVQKQQSSVKGKCCSYIQKITYKGF